ncbi:leucine-rich repeat domain-containing protein [Oceanobacillus jeddahense]|uniref:Leucine-rich repeat domain-containing protein n=1 Tax=Oceanobacillus jeddahense TaxID=1462527 RepID=A0ABY5JUQ7_9BACI|nr:leucine-rich repeat domain-containing protein [Oceanobacillus jeddahense]UUI02304.1 hypothetical protein NP439_20045 [Oceanobacillus jeddahense]
MDENEISDVTPLSNLENLQWLHLDENAISDITPLSNLKNLEILFLNNNAISDLDSLTDLENLWQLGLDDNLIEDITPLKELSLMDMYIRLNGNKFNDDDTINYLRNSGAIVDYDPEERNWEEDETETLAPDEEETEDPGKPE